MNILVCIKQVPGSSNVEVDPVTGVLKRDGVASKMNPYDLYGLEVAMSLAETYGGEVKTVTMGPPPAKAIIVESICMGAKCGTVLSDRKFAGADVLATAYTISQGIRRMGDFDLITLSMVRPLRRASVKALRPSSWFSFSSATSSRRLSSRWKSRRGGLRRLSSFIRIPPVCL